MAYLNRNSQNGMVRKGVSGYNVSILVKKNFKIYFLIKVRMMG